MPLKGLALACVDGPKVRRTVFHKRNAQATDFETGSAYGVFRRSIRTPTDLAYRKAPGFRKRTRTRETDG